MPWQPTQAATFASIDFAPPAAGVPPALGCAGACAAAGAGACAMASPVTQATAAAKSMVNNVFILRAQSGERLSVLINL
jgi:hypothetical protein